MNKTDLPVLKTRSFGETSGSAVANHIAGGGNMVDLGSIECRGIWEQINNQGFKPLEFDRFRSREALNSFVLSPKNLAAVITQTLGDPSANNPEHHFASVGKPISFCMAVA